MLGWVHTAGWSSRAGQGSQFLPHVGLQPMDGRMGWRQVVHKHVILLVAPFGEILVVDTFPAPVNKQWASLGGLGFFCGKASVGFKGTAF